MAGAVRTRIDWKCALGLGLPDPGFDGSILSEFRTRAATGGLEQVVLDTLLKRLAAEGLVPAGGAMRTDSTHVICAVRNLNRLELAWEAVRACLEVLAVAAPHKQVHEAQLAARATQGGARREGRQAGPDGHGSRTC